MVVFDYQGETIVQQNSVERNLLINSNEYDNIYDIAVRPLEDTIKSVDGKVEIPLDNFFINNNKEDVYFKYNEYSYLFRGLSMDMAKNITAKIRDFGMIPAGTYNLNLEIQATNSETTQIESMTTFNLQFIVPVKQEISLFGERPKITVGANDAFTKNKKIINEISPMIFINSNCDWELSVILEDTGNDIGNYFVRTITSTSNVNERLQERVLLQPNREIVLAKGKAPANNENISVEYSLEGKDGNIIHSGNYENRVRYILRESRD